MSQFKQAARTGIDGAVGVNRNADETLTLSATHDGVEQGLTVTPYNAARLYASIGLMLGIPFHATVGKAINL